MNTDFLTTREKIFLLLSYSDEPLTAKEIMRRLDIRKEKEIYDHLEHLARSSKRKGYILIMIPARCKSCGYIFNSEKIKRPSRCPICKSEKIEMPKFLIRNK
ncbi:transcriptional regulator [Sulfolobus sp. E5-1-F]|uniref:transcriptional regulator n=1 Tax=Sulfolobaceae TaxID=118883 RepID=UPI001294A57F|nr:MULTISPECIES: transcriptional regulator [unclassified Sulfolobus]QGA53335.1 transcriptional regulator [Sulfolobus sp. E5-1-F]QGA68444.1 transcriptional regulator [Sulfolobus sp. E11-6]